MKENVEQFKRDLQSYKSYKRTVNKLNDDLKVIENKMIGLKSTRFDTVPRHQGAGASIDLDLIEKKDEVEKEIAIYQHMIQLTDSRLAKLKKVDRDVLVLVYMENVSIRKIARTFYMSDSSVFRWIERACKKALS